MKFLVSWDILSHYERECGGFMTRTARRLSQEARREQLLTAAIACYAELGVERAGHGDIAKRVGVSTATVFNYFETREVLTQAVFKHVYLVFDEMFDALPEPSLSTKDQIKNLSASYDFLVEKHPDILKLVLNWSSSFGQSVRPQYLEFQEWVIAKLQQRVQKLDLDASLARTVLATAYTYSQMKNDGTPDHLLEDYLDGVSTGFDPQSK